MSDWTGLFAIIVGATLIVACVVFMIATFISLDLMDYVTDPSSRRIEVWLAGFVGGLAFVALGGWITDRDQLVSLALIVAVGFSIPNIFRMMLP